MSKSKKSKKLDETVLAAAAMTGLANEAIADRLGIRRSVVAGWMKASPEDAEGWRLRAIIVGARARHQEKTLKAAFDYAVAEPGNPVLLKLLIDRSDRLIGTGEIEAVAQSGDVLGPLRKKLANLDKKP